jgi:aromatic-L-amino-acid decarboxylase
MQIPGHDGLTTSAMFDELRQMVQALESEVDSGPIVPTVAPEQIRRHLARYDFSEPVALEDVGLDVQNMMKRWHVQVTHSRYLGLFNPSVTFASIVGETLAAMYNPQLATWRTSPAANEIERHVLIWLAKQFGLPVDVSACFTSGGSEANFSAIVIALAHAFPEFREHGLRGIPKQPTVYATSHAHHALSKFLCMTGLGQSALRLVTTDGDFRMDVNDLARSVARDRADGMEPFMVVGTAGTTAAGVIDPLPDLVNFSRSQNIWCHIDAAWGGAAIISPKLKGHLAGIEEADSITCDAHKWFSVPMGAGMFFCRHPDAVHRAFSSESSFMPPKTGWGADPYTTSVQWSRRFIGLKLFLSLAHLGKTGYAAMIERQAYIGTRLRESLEATGWRIVNSTPFPLVCFTRDGLDAITFSSELHRRQIAWISAVELGGGSPVLRACVTSIRTTEDHIDYIVEEMNKLFAGTDSASNHAAVPGMGSVNAA